MKNWIKTVCFLLWTCVMCTACIDDDVEEGTVDLQTGENIPVFSVVMDDGQIITSETLKGEGREFGRDCPLLGRKSFDFALFGPRKPHGILSVC